MVEETKKTTKKAPAAKASAAPKTVKADKAAPKKAAKKAPTGKTITVQQIASPISRAPIQHATLVGLGLGKINRTKVLEDTPSVRGMVNKIKHLVRIVEEAA